ncbi:MAG: mechanosensitive ion channel family protein [Halioglobus sp.]
MKDQCSVYVIALVAITLLLTPCHKSFAYSPQNPLAPADTSSPRSTLFGFIDIVNSSNTQLKMVVSAYKDSSRLYFSKEEIQEIDRVYQKIELARRTLNFSELPAALAVTEPLFRYRIFQLKEVLDRLELPPKESVPDAAAMSTREFKRWTLPGTEITIERVEQGSQAGEYLFSPETVERLPEFYDRIKHLPYQSNETAGWYERYRYGGAGLRAVIPLKWMNSMPGWAKVPVMAQPVWRWIGVVIVAIMATGLFLAVRQAGRTWERREKNSLLRPLWSRLAQVISLLLLIPLVIYILTVNLRFSGFFLEFSTLFLWAIFTLALTWSAWLTCSVLAETIVASQKLIPGSIDSQLIRLALRLVATILSVTVLVVGAQQLGIPAYSVIAGLGVGGIAFALAAKDSLANLLGSLLIMFEKPFRIGHWVKVGDTEGIVENIGFRSTRIRSFHDSLVAIPSDQLVNSAVDNMSMRHRQVQETVFKIAYSTTRNEIENLITCIECVIRQAPTVHDDESFVRIDHYSEGSFHLLIHCSLDISDYQKEKMMWHDMLMQFLKVIEANKIELVG